MYRRVGAVAVVVVLAALVVPVTAPVSVSFVHSGSMEPTIPEGDGFVLVPAGEVRTGDVVTFDSEHRGEYVTHRVVGTSEDGFVTRGDANPTTDQEVGHPPVTRDAIVGAALTVGGTQVVIPGLGDAVAALSAARDLLVAAALAAGLLLARGSGTRPGRAVTTTREMFRSLLAVAVVTSVGLILLGGTTVAVPVADSEANAGPRDVVLSDGEPATIEFEVSRSPVMSRTVTADGARVVGSEGDGNSLTLGLASADAGDEAQVSFYRYPPVLPETVLATLQRLHPSVAALASVLVTFLPVYGATHLLFVGREPLRSPRWPRKRGGGS